MNWAERIVPACQDLCDTLTDAFPPGVTATLSRSTLRIPGAWVMPSTAEGLTLDGSGTCRVNVLLVAPNAGNKDEEALRDLQGLLVAALTVVGPVLADDVPVDTSVVFPHGQNMQPAFRLTVDIPLED